MLLEKGLKLPHKMTIKTGFRPEDRAENCRYFIHSLRFNLLCSGVAQVFCSICQTRLEVDIVSFYNICIDCDMKRTASINNKYLIVCIDKATAFDGANQFNEILLQNIKRMITEDYQTIHSLDKASRGNAFSLLCNSNHEAEEPWPIKNDSTYFFNEDNIFNGTFTMKDILIEIDKPNNNDNHGCLALHVQGLAVTSTSTSTTYFRHVLAVMCYATAERLSVSYFPISLYGEACGRSVKVLRMLQLYFIGLREQMQLQLVTHFQHCTCYYWFLECRAHLTTVSLRSTFAGQGSLGDYNSVNSCSPGHGSDDNYNPAAAVGLASSHSLYPPAHNGRYKCIAKHTHTTVEIVTGIAMFSVGHRKEQLQLVSAITPSCALNQV